MRNFLFILAAFLTLGVTAQQKTFNSNVKINGDLKVKKATPIIKLDNTSNSGDITLGSLTASRTWALPDASGTIALTSDIPSVSTPGLQDVLIQNNTAITEGNWQFGTNRSRVTPNAGFYAQDPNFQANYKKNGIVFRNVSSNNKVEINFSGSTGSHIQSIQDASGTIALTSDIVTPGLQDVLAKNNTALTEGNWQFGTNRSRITPNAGFYAQNSVFQANYKKNGIVFRDISSNNQIEINFSGATGTHVQSIQDASGTIALTSDIPSTANFVPYIGASQDLNLGANDLTATQITGGILKSTAPVNPVIQLINTGTNNTVSLASNSSPLSSLYQVEMPPSSGVLALTSQLPLKTINSASAKTSASLNIDFPLASNPIGTRVVNINSSQKYMYIRVGNTSWLQSALMTGI